MVGFVRERQGSWVLAVLTTGLLLGSHVGCDGNSAAPPSAPQESAAPQSANTALPAANPTPVAEAALDPALHQSFADATRKDPPADQRPTDRTLTGKSVGKLYTEVARVWDSIHFTSAGGKRLRCCAVVETALGDFEIEFRPDVAPNHVRNFLALARVGYYDGLVFDRIHHEEAQEPAVRLEQVQAGCPLGTGEAGFDSIGYWLKPEFSTKLPHEEGTVGACRSDEPDSAACRFYITLCKAPYLDGEYTTFGKVVKGLDVVRKIYAQPIILEDQDRNGSRRPLTPVVIRKVTILTQEE